MNTMTWRAPTDLKEFLKLYAKYMGIPLNSLLNIIARQWMEDRKLAGETIEEIIKAIENSRR